MKGALRWALRIFVVVLVGISSMLITMRLAIHGREVVLPRFIGLSSQDANKLADENGVTLVLENRFFSSEVLEGHVITQVPQPGVKVRRGWRVRVAESLGPQRIMIPSVLGESPRAAELNIRRRGLELGGVAEISIPGKTPGEVIAQSPPPDARGIASPKVSVLVAAEPEMQAFVMPDLTGLRLDQAQSTITAAGMKVGTIANAKSGTDTAAGSTTVVTHHYPAPGQRVTPGSPVNLELGHL